MTHAYSTWGTSWGSAWGGSWGVLQPVTPTLPGGPSRGLRRPYRRLRINHIFLREDEPEKVLKPTPARIRKLQKAVLVEAAGLLGQKLPVDAASELRRDVKRAYTPRVTPEMLERYVEEILQVAIERAKQQIEQEDEEIFLMSLL